MQMSTGTNKTEAMHFPVADRIFGPEPAPHAPLRLGAGPTGGPVNFTDSYRYLGYTLHRRLEATDLVNTLKTNLNISFARTFRQTTVTRGLSISTQNQLFIGTVLGSVNHLLSLAPDDPRIERELNDAIWYHAAQLTNVTAASKGINKSLPIAHLHLPSAAFLTARERMRLAFSLEHTAPHDTHAHRIYTALNTGANDSTNAHTNPRMKSWTYERKRHLAQYTAHGIPAAAVNPLGHLTGRPRDGSGNSTSRMAQTQPRPTPAAQPSRCTVRDAPTRSLLRCCARRRLSRWRPREGALE